MPSSHGAAAHQGDGEARSAGVASLARVTVMPVILFNSHPCDSGILRNSFPVTAFFTTAESAIPVSASAGVWTARTRANTATRKSCLFSRTVRASPRTSSLQPLRICCRAVLQGIRLESRIRKWLELPPSNLLPPLRELRPRVSLRKPPPPEKSCVTNPPDFTDQSSRNKIITGIAEEKSVSRRLCPLRRVPPPRRLDPRRGETLRSAMPSSRGGPAAPPARLLDTWRMRRYIKAAVGRYGSGET